MEKKESFEVGLSRILVEQGAITSDESKAVQKAFRDSAKEQFDEFLLDEGLIEEEDLLEALAEYYQVPAFDVVGHFFDTFELRKFPKDVLLRNAFIPLEVDENIMLIVASEPDNPELLDIIGENVSYDIQFLVGIRRDICDSVKEFYDKAYTEESQDIDLREERQAIRDEYMAEEEEGESPYLEDEEESFEVYVNTKEED